MTIPTYAETWFESSSPLNQAHQKLLDNDLEGSFSSIVQVWQTEPDAYVENHLNELLLKSLENDCGKTLSNEPLLPWIINVTVKRQSIQSPGRRVSRVIVEVTSEEKIKNIKLGRWPEEKLATESNFETIPTDNRTIYRKSYELSQRLRNGLYRVEVSNFKGEVWTSWIVIGEQKAKRIVRWDSQDTWAIDKFNRLNPYCALPKLTVSLYDYINNEYVRVWHKEYESDYPSKLPLSGLKPERYVLAIGITHQRWQGNVVIEDQQVISKTYDISSE